jgi:hypothetical protein
MSSAAPRAHTDLHMEGSGDVWVAVTPEVVYDAIVGLRRMDPDGGWDTTCTVIDAFRPERFAWSVFPPGDVGTTWRFGLAPDRGGTLVREAFVWDWTAYPDEGFRGRVGRMPLAAAALVVADRERQLRAAIRVTLDALKAGLESG